MISTAELIIVDGVRVVVPDSLSLITPYVLLEQQDWFEDEIKFLRRFLQSGQKVIDIGANYGVYTLSMAYTVGHTGRVWAFEPASGTARLLAEGIAANNFPQVVLEQSALSSTCGSAQLSLNENSELNALEHGNPTTSACETVRLVTLDECMERYGWQDIDFMKIDAEGEEGNILKGGGQFFATLSPLVQYEIKDGADFHNELVQKFVELGYNSYRLVPGLDLLVPFDAESTPDGYLLNLFCCKRDRAELLAAQGFLLDSVPHSRNTKAEEIKNFNAYGWRHTIAKLPYGVRLSNAWEQTMGAGNGAEVEEALTFYAISRDLSLSSSERFSVLMTSFSLLKALCERQPSHMRWATLARVARDFGARKLAVNALGQLSNSILQSNQVNLNEPFLTAGERFDSVIPSDAISNWALASILEEFERIASFSSFYTGMSAQQRLEIIHTLGFGSAEMERRLRLLQRRFGLPAVSAHQI